MTSATSVPDLQSAFAERRLAVLRRRLTIFFVAVGCVLLALTLLAQSAIHGSSRPLRIQALAPAFGGVAMIVSGIAKRNSKRRAELGLSNLIRRSMAMVVMAVAMQIPASALVARGLTDALTRSGLDDVHIGAVAPLLISLLCVHLTAAIILPWSVIEAAIPIGVLLVIAFVAAPFAPDPWPARLGGILALAIMGLPGIALCWFRSGRLRNVVELGYFSDRYRETQRELSYARRIHEKVFPVPITAGPITFDFRYQPMKQIGGDFVDVIRATRDDPASDLTVVLVDVTGHGIAAALAVNRLHGEIKRVTSSTTDASPGEILTALNAYVHHTLADESVFATAAAMRVSATDRSVTYASAGHPPMFIVERGSIMQALDSTAMMLGPMSPEQFDAGETTVALGDEAVTLFAYTDGAIESRDRDGAMLDITGLRLLIASASEGPVMELDDIVRTLTAYRWGEPEDDLLLLTVAIGAK